MNVATLGIAIGGDPSGLFNALNGGMRGINKFTKDLQRVSATATPFKGAAAGAIIAAQQAVKSFEDRFNRDMASARVRLASGAIDEKQFRVVGQLAGQQFNRALLEKMRDLEAGGHLLDPVKIAFAEKFKEIGAGAGDAFQAEIRRKIAAVDATGLGALGRKLQGIGNQLTATVTLPIVALGTLATKLAVDAANAADKFNKAFGPAAVRISGELTRLKQVIPATTSELQDMASKTRVLLIPLGIAPRRAEDMSVAIVKLASDIANLNEVPLKDTLDNLLRGLIGRGRGLNQLGLNINDTTLRAEAFRLGLITTNKALTDGQTAIAAFSLAQKQMALALGDTERSINDADTQFAFLKRDLKEVATVMGRELLPAVLPIVRAIGNVAKVFASMPPAVLQTVVTILALGAALGPVLKLVGLITSGFGLLQKASLLLSGATGLGALASGGVIVAGVAAGIGLIAGLIHQMGKEAGDTAASIKTFRDEIGNLTPEDQTAKLDATLTRINRLQQAFDAASAHASALAKDTRVDEGVPELRTTVNRQVVVLGDSLAVARREANDLVTALNTQGSSLAQQQAAAKRYADALGLASGAANKLGDTIEDGRTPMDRFIERTQGAIAVLNDMRAGGKRTDGVITELAGAFAQARAALDKIPTAEQFGKPALALRDLMNAIAKVPEVAVRFRFDTNTQELKLRTEAEIKAITETTFLPLNVVPTISTDAASAVKKQLDFLLSAFVFTGVPLDTQRAILQALGLQPGATTKAIAVPVEFKPTITGGLDLTNIQNALKGLADAEVLENLAKLTGNFKDLRSAADKVATAQGKVRNQAQVLMAAFASANIPIALQIQILKQLGISANGVGKDMTTAEEKLHALIQAGRGLLQIADGFGKIDDSTRKTIEGVLSLGEAITSLKAPNASFVTKLGGVVGAIGAVAAILSSFFSKSASAQEHDDILRANSRELAQLRFEISGLSHGITQLDVAGIIEGPIIQMAAKVADFAGQLPRSSSRVLADFDKQLRNAGISLEELQQVARENGIQILDSKGRLVAGALDDLAKKIRLTAIGLAKLTPEAQAIARRVGLRPNTPQQEALDTQFQIQQTFPELGKFFVGLTSQSGEAIRKAIRDIVQAGPSGTGLTAAKFQELIPLLNQWLDAVDKMTDAAFRFGNSLSDLTAQMNLEADVFDFAQGAQASIDQGLQLLQRLAPDLLAKFFAGIDPKNTNQVEQSLRALTRAFLDGTIDLAAFGGLLNKDELIQIIRLVEGGLDGLADAANTATDAMLNVPQGFKIAGFRFVAMATNVAKEFEKQAKFAVAVPLPTAAPAPKFAVAVPLPPPPPLPPVPVDTTPALKSLGDEADVVTRALAKLAEAIARITATPIITQAPVTLSAAVPTADTLLKLQPVFQLIEPPAIPVTPEFIVRPAPQIVLTPEFLVEPTAPLIVTPDFVLRPTAPLLVTPTLTLATISPLVVAPDFVVQPAQPLVVTPSLTLATLSPLVIAPQFLVQPPPPLVVTPTITLATVSPLFVAPEFVLQPAAPLVVTPTLTLATISPLLITPSFVVQPAAPLEVLPKLLLAPTPPIAVTPSFTLGAVPSLEVSPRLVVLQPDPLPVRPALALLEPAPLVVTPHFLLPDVVPLPITPVFDLLPSPAISVLPVFDVLPPPPIPVTPDFTVIAPGVVDGAIAVTRSLSQLVDVIARITVAPLTQTVTTATTAQIVDRVSVVPEASTTGGDIIINGDLLIDAREKDIEAVFQEVRKVVKIKARAALGIGRRPHEMWDLEN